MDGLKEAVKNIKLIDTDAIVKQGRLAYRMGFEKRANPINLPSHRNLWDRGYDLEQSDFTAMMQRWKSL